MCEVQTGIDTFCCYHVLTSCQKSKIVEALTHSPGFCKVGDDYWANTVLFASTCFINRGVKLSVFRKEGGPWGLFVIVHPMLVLGKLDRSMLYLPQRKKEYKEIVKAVDTLLKTVHVPCSIDDMKLSRIDVTANLIFQDKAVVEQYLHILKKGCLLPHYRFEYFKENEQKAKDCKLANQHSYKQSCKSAAFFVYDKTAQLEMIDKFPKTLHGKHILRLEAQLRRKVMKKWVSNGEIGSNWNLLEELGHNTAKILRWYLKRTQPVQAPCVRYEDAAAKVSTVKNTKTQERMLYLLRKTSDSRDLTSALEKLKEHFNLKKGQVSHVLKKFDKLDISPVTFPNSSKQTSLPPARQLLSQLK